MAQSITWPLLKNIIRGKKINHTFGMVRRYRDGRPKPHQGWDFAAAVGTPTYAIADGKVEFVHKNLGDYGTQICLQFKFNEKIHYAFYAHLNSTRVSQGAQVKKGQQIGTTGISGNARRLARSEAHLHFEIRTRASCGRGLGGRVSPLGIFGKCPLTSSVVVTPIITAIMAPMCVYLKGSVGKNGNNFVEDVLIVQKLLNNKTKPPYALLNLAKRVTISTTFFSELSTCHYLYLV